MTPQVSAVPSGQSSGAERSGAAPTGPRRRGRRGARLAVAGLLLAVALPGSGTGASLTAAATASASDVGTGSWCALPDEALPNVYRLVDLPAFTSSLDGSTTRMIIVPVVNASGEAADDFAPVVDRPQSASPDGSKQLGVRTWACSPTDVAVDGGFKVSAWRRDVASSAELAWLPALSSAWSGQRLDPERGWGLEMQRLHTWGSEPALTDSAPVAGQHRQQYSWVVGYPRKRTSTTSSPQCSRPSSCTLQTRPGPLRKDVFQGDDGTSAVPRNDVTYLATRYWTGTGEGAGDWPATAVPLTTVLLPLDADGTAPSAGGAEPLSTDGRQVQWLVVEWTGKVPAAHMRLEVFLQ